MSTNASTPEGRQPNHGPGAAEGNRRALIAAAAEVFGELGVDAPLSTVARRAGVGQGTLYRHFPDRVSLALAAFEDNVAALEQRAHGGATLDDLLDLLTEQTVASVAFVNVITAETGDDRVGEVAARVRKALEGPLREARGEDAVRESLDVDELMLAVGMVAAMVALTPAAQRRATADACWELLRRGV